MQHRLRAGLNGLYLSVAVAISATALDAHPHVFVDGGIDFVFDDDAMLTSLKVTWIYDEFETLYLLASHGLGLNSNGRLKEEDRQELEDQLGVWPDDFDGSAHLSVDSMEIDLNWPTDVSARLVDGRLEKTFTRELMSPIDLRNRKTEVAFYESTYFFEFRITKSPEFAGPDGLCSAEIIPFDPAPNDASLLETLAKLSREERPEQDNVGALLADRISLRCV